MADPEFRIRLGAEDDIAQTSEAAVQALNRLDNKATRTQQRLAAINRERSKYARESRAAAFSELSVQEKLTRLRERQLLVEQRLARAQGNAMRTAVLRLRQQQLASQIGGLQGVGLPPVLPGASRGTKGGGIVNLLSRIVPGGERVAGIGAAAGVGVAGTFGVGAGFAALAGIKSLVDEAVQLDTTAQKTAESIANLTRFSDPVVESLSEVAHAFQFISGVIRKFLAENLARQLETGKLLVGGAQQVLGKFGFFLPSSIRNILSKSGSELSGKAFARLFQGGTGAQDVGRAEARLKDAQKAREEGKEKAKEEIKEKRRNRGSAGGGSGVFPEVDELARIGLFRGSGPGQTLVGLQREANKRLESIDGGVRALPSNIADNL